MYFSSIILEDFIAYADIKNIDLSELKNMISVKENQIDFEEMSRILKILNQKLNDPCLGLHIGEQLSLKVTAYVDKMMLYSDSLEEAFNNAVSYSKMISDALECSLHKTGTHYSVSFEENPNWKVMPHYTKNQILDLTLLSCLKSIVAYTNKNYYPVEIHFERSKAKYLNEYYRLFNCRLHFNKPSTQIVFEKHIFDKHTKENPIGLLANLKEKVTVQMNNLSIENDLIYQLKKHILAQKPQRIIIDEASEKLNLSTRTLQRKLTQQNTSFKNVEQELQLRLAKTYIEENEYSIDEISYLLGFSESSAFIRFFKSQTGQTPKQHKYTINQLYK